MILLPLLLDGPYDRLAGHYRGPMYFHDLSDNKDKSFEIDLKIAKDADESSVSWNWKYRFAPPRYSLEIYTAQAIQDGTLWESRKPDETLKFNLSNWKEFAAGTSDWFGINRFYLSLQGPSDYRQRFTLKQGGLWSEKWIRLQGKEWEFSHRMELKRIK